MRAETVSPGESVNLNIDLINANYNPSLLIKAKIIKKSNSAVLFDQTLELPFQSTPLPGSLFTPTLSVPVIPFEIVGVPAELSLQAKLVLETDYLVDIETYGVEPTTMSLTFRSMASQDIPFSKRSGVGSSYTIRRTGITLEGSILVSAGITVVNIPTPLSHTFSTIPISWGAIYFSHNHEFCILKTPVDIRITSAPDIINKGVTLNILGTTNPPLKSHSSVI